MLALLYLANDILQNSRKKGPQFVNQFYAKLPLAMHKLVKAGGVEVRSPFYPLQIPSLTSDTSNFHQAPGMTPRAKFGLSISFGGAAKSHRVKMLFGGAEACLCLP